ncbi:hypothetical protein J4216_04360 [Candidatus Woesearchaeota archaeon]|nr:hypothetical protein [Candidatus Woesearchaeota archaeon]
MKLIKKIYKLSFFLVISDLVYLCIALIPRLILSFKDLSLVAYYDIGLILYGLFLLIVNNVTIPLIPMISRINTVKNRDFSFLYKFININYFIGLVFVYSIVVILFITTKLDYYIIFYVFGDKYVPSINIFRIIIFFLPAQAYFAIYSGILQGLGMTKQLFKSSIYALLISFLVYIIFMNYGVGGLTFAYGFNILIFTCLLNYEINKFLKENISINSN